MKILGVHDGHTSTAALLEDGRIVAAASEERFRRKKCFTGFPELAIEWALEYTGTEPGDLDLVVFPTTTVPLEQGQLDLQESATLFRRAVALSTRALPGAIIGSEALVPTYQALRRRSLSRQKAKLKSMGITAPIRMYDHHTAHAAGALFSGLDDALVLTLDGSGDGYSGSVWTFKDGQLDEKMRLSAYHSLGEIYTRVTQYLGMKPLEHEYKVMGLAPYAPDFLAKKGYEVFEKMFTVDGLRIRNTSGRWGLAFYDLLKSTLPGLRFDAVAAGLQARLEDVVTTWVSNWMSESKKNDLVLSGGVFMNVKLNGKLSRMARELFVFPSGGDESLALTAAGLAYYEETGKLPEELGPLYFGPEHEWDGQTDLPVTVEKVSHPDKRAGELVAAGKIVARSSGRMEWGARALGNRSIMANASNLRSVWRINKAIKMRDFWMPFAPSVLDKWRDRYFEDARYAPYMVLAFDATELAREHIIAGLHQGDLSGRPQTVSRDWNPGYHRVLSVYENKTGMGGFLNTSFNLHGDPIVNTPEDALYTLVNSDLHYLFIDDYMVVKK
jgi:carbamoyltransferase